MTQESKSLFKGNEPTIWRLRDEVKEIIGIELYSDAVPNYVNEALKLNQNQMDTEHLLLGLIREGRGIAVEVLRELSVNLEELEMKVMAMIKKPNVSTDAKQSLGFTNASKQVFQYAAEEAQKVESDYVCAEHVLLGSIREENGIAVQTLTNFGVTLEKVRELLEQSLGILNYPNTPLPQYPITMIPHWMPLVVFITRLLFTHALRPASLPGTRKVIKPLSQM